MFPRLSCCAAQRIYQRMRALSVLGPLLILPILLVISATGPVLAQQKHAPAPAKPAPAGSSAPKSLGKFEDWTAAIHQEGGQKVCYAFTAGNPRPR